MSAHRTKEGPFSPGLAQTIPGFGRLRQTRAHEPTLSYLPAFATGTHLLLAGCTGSSLSSSVSEASDSCSLVSPISSQMLFSTQAAKEAGSCISGMSLPASPWDSMDAVTGHLSWSREPQYRCLPLITAVLGLYQPSVSFFLCWALGDSDEDS